MQIVNNYRYMKRILQMVNTSLFIFISYDLSSRLFLNYLLCDEEIYRQKLQQCVADGELSDKDVSALLKLRVMLCIPQQTVETAHTDICGSLFEKVMIFWHLLLLIIMSSIGVSKLISLTD